MNPRHNEIQQRENEFYTILKETLGLPMGISLTSADDIPGGNIDISVRLPEDFGQFKDSGYFFTGKSIVHFTNISAAFSILKSSNLRLYNLYYKNDKTEFTFASDLIKEFCKPTESYFTNYDGEVQVIRYLTFILSATSILNIDLFWRKNYTMNGKGIGLEISFINDPINWRGFYLSEVKYGTFNDLLLFRDRMIFLKKRHPNVNYKINLNQIIPFYKNPCWMSEKEIRLMTFFPNEFGVDICKDTGDDKIKCICLPIFSSYLDQNKLYGDKVPLLKIERLFLGPHVNKDEIAELIKITKQHYPYKIEIVDYIA